MIAIYENINVPSEQAAEEHMELHSYALQFRKVEWYQDGGEVSTKGMPALLYDLAQGKITRIVAYSLAHFGRTSANLVAWVEELQAKRCVLVTIKEGIDTSQHANCFLSHLRAIVANDAAQKEARTTKRAEKTKRPPNLGRPVGTPVKVDHLFKERVMQMVRAQMSVTEIADRMNVSRTTIYKVIQEEQGKGKGK